jgi:hypothetical protein
VLCDLAPLYVYGERSEADYSGVTSGLLHGALTSPVLIPNGRHHRRDPESIVRVAPRHFVTCVDSGKAA